MTGFFHDLNWNIASGQQSCVLGRAIMLFLSTRQGLNGGRVYKHFQPPHFLIIYFLWLNLSCEVKMFVRSSLPANPCAGIHY